MSRTTSRGIEPIYKIIVPVWGEQFVARFMQYGLPSQLAPGNLPALPRDRCAYHLFTTSADAEVMRRASAFQLLSRLMPTRVETIDDLYRGHAYAAMTECHNRGLALGRGKDCVFVFLSPDSLWADGSFRAMHEQIGGGKRAVLMAGPRVVAETLLPLVGARSCTDDWSIRLTGRELATLLVQHMHHSTRAYLWQAGGSRGAGHYCWIVGEQGMLIRATHLHPVAVRPVDRNIRLTTNLDGDFVGRCCPDVSQIHVVTDSDEMCTLEFSSAGYLEGFYPDTSLSRSEHLAFLEKNTDAHHREYLRRCICIHAREIGRAWREAESESQRVVEGLLAEFDSCSLPTPAIPADRPRIASRLRRWKRAVLVEPLRTIRLGPFHPSSFRPEGKHGFMIDLSELGVFARSDLDYQGRAGSHGVSRLELLENDKPLGPPHQMHDVIRNRGRGTFSHWGNGLLFSTSDNTDPRTNGRIYSIRVPESLAAFMRRGWWKLKRRLRAA
jgi:hypothetical protein